MVLALYHFLSTPIYETPLLFPKRNLFASLKTAGSKYGKGYVPQHTH